MESPKLALEVVQLWADAPQKAELYLAGQSVTIGDQTRASFMLPTDVMPEIHELATLEGDAWMVRVPAGATLTAEAIDAAGSRHIDVSTLPMLANGQRMLRLAEGMQAKIVLGAFSFFLRATEPAEKAATSPIVSWSEHRWLAVSLAAHCVFLGALFFAPPRAGALVLDADPRNLERVRVTIEAVEQERLEEENLVQDMTGQGGSEGAPMAGEEGAAGAENTPTNTGGGVQVRGESRDRTIPLTAADVRSINMLNTLSQFTASLSPISSPFGAEGVTGFADIDAYGDLSSAIPGFSSGSNGFGMRGVGRGGCPDGATNCLAGAVGVGDHLNTGIGRGCDPEQFERLVNQLGRAAAVDRCSGVGAPIGVGDRMGRNAHVPPPIGGVPTTTGGLSREQIRRTVQLHIPEVRHCYEQALITRPDLEGRVSEHFTIMPDGRVQGASPASSSLNNPTVEACVTAAVSRWSFPQSPSPTIVSYPFTFTAARN